jgi:hypothetical protein
MNQCAVVCTLAGMVLGSACTARVRPPIQHASGCYALELGAWSGPVAGAPPLHIALDTVKPAGTLIPWAIDPRRARPNIPQTRSPSPAIWFIDTLNVLHVRWTNGYSGFGLTLSQQADGDLAGQMDAFSDSPLPSVRQPTRTARARHIACATAGI